MKGDFWERRNSPAEVLGPLPQGSGQAVQCWWPWLDWTGQTGRPCRAGPVLSPALSPEHRGSEVLWNFWGFNKCVFTNVSLGENIFLLFLCVASLGLAVEVQPIV